MLGVTTSNRASACSTPADHPASRDRARAGKPKGHDPRRIGRDDHLGPAVIRQDSQLGKARVIEQSRNAERARIVRRDDSSLGLIMPLNQTPDHLPSTAGCSHASKTTADKGWIAVNPSRTELPIPRCDHPLRIRSARIEEPTTLFCSQSGHTQSEQKGCPRSGTICRVA